MNDFYVYILFHPETGLPFYVGKGRNRRIRAHLSDLRCNSEKAEIVKRAIALGLDIPAVKVKEGLKEFEAFRLEEIYIAVIGRSPDGPLVNRSDGGQGRTNPSAEARARLAEAVRLARTGTTLPPEVRAKISAAARGRKPSPQNVEAVRRANTGRHVPEELALRRSAWKRGKAHSPGHVAAIRAALKGRSPSAATLEARRKQVALARAAKPRKTCPICKANFLPRRAKQEFCSKSCSGTNNRRQVKNVHTDNSGQHGFIAQSC